MGHSYAPLLYKEETNMYPGYQELANFKDINPAPKADILLVTSFHTKTFPNTSTPFQMILNVAMDKYNANSLECEFTVAIPAANSYRQEDHLKMLELFRTGNYWVPVECKNLVLFRRYDGKHFKYWAYATSFKVIDYDAL